MQINDQVKKALEEFSVPLKDGIPYLICLYFGYEPSYIPDMLKQKVNATGIVIIDAKGTLQWRVPLFEGQETAFGWVQTEYVPLFSEANPKKGGKVREATARMKKFFANNPEIRKEDIIAATKLYLLNSDPRFIRFPHFFIEKGKGVDRISDLEDWLDKYKANQARIGNTSERAQSRSLQ